MSDAASFAYVAIDGRRRRVRGVLDGADPAAVHARLKSEGLTPVSIRKTSAQVQGPARTSGGPGDRLTAQMVMDLATLLRAGADIRAALSIIADKASSPALASAARLIATDVSGGESLDQALTRNLGGRGAFVAALASAGEASGDLAGGLERAGAVLETRIRMREQLVSALTYPAFVLISAIFGLVVILMMVIPSLAPLAEAPGANPGMGLSVLLGMSRFLTENLLPLGLGLILVVILIAAAAVAGVLGALLDRLFLDGPLRGAASQLVYGGFAVTLGGILAAGAQISEALRFSVDAVRSQEARRRLSPLLNDVRQGEALSHAISKVPGMPTAITRLAMIGEESGALGPMLARAGRLEEEAAIKHIEAMAGMLGPAMIVLLGALIGLLMAGLLSGIADIGASALG